MAAVSRALPNILICGTPGTGKSTLASQVSEQLQYRLIDVPSIIKENAYYEEYDPEYECHVLDEEKLLDHIEDDLLSPSGGCVVDYHASELFAKRWFDLVLVLRTNTETLYDRLNSRGYNQKKVQDNVQCEIFNVMTEEAKESYDPSIVFELQSNTPDEMQSNVDWVREWIKKWTQERKSNQNGVEDMATT